MAGAAEMRRRAGTGNDSSKKVAGDPTYSMRQGPGSRAALRDVLLDLRTSRVRRQSRRPGNFRRIEWLPLGIFKVAGVLPWNLSSTKISAPSGSEEMETVPTPSGAAGEEEFAGCERALVSVRADGVAAGWEAAATFG